MITPDEDAALAEFLCPDDLDLGVSIVVAFDQKQRAAYERLAEICDEIDLWQLMVTQSTGVILCDPKQVKAGRP